MKIKSFNFTAKTFGLVLAALLIAFAGVQAFDLTGTHNFAASAAKAVPVAELKSATEAKRALARIGSPNFAKIKDARKRDAMQKSYDAIKALANNTSQAQEASLAANLARTGLALKAFPAPKTATFQECDNSYKTCMELCKELGGNCELCVISNHMCYQAGLIAAWLDDCEKNINLC